MNKSFGLPAFEDMMSAATKEQYPLPDKEFVERLRSKIASSTPPKTRQSGWPGMIWMKPRRVVIGTIFVIMLLATLIIGPQNVIAAIRNLLGYFPGVGFTEATMVLVEPVTVERDGITVTVENLVATEKETILVYRLQNLPIEKTFGLCPESIGDDPDDPCVQAGPIYKLQDEEGNLYSDQLIRGSGSADDRGRSWISYLVFPPLPSDISQVTFVIGVLPNMYPGLAPENWEFSLDLQPASEGDQIPAYQPEYATLTPNPETQSDETSSSTPNSTSALRDHVQLQLNAVSIEDEILTLRVSILWEDDDWSSVEILDFSSMQNVKKGGPFPHLLSLMDANGEVIPLTLNSLESPGTEYGSNKATYILSADVTDKEFASPLILRLNGIMLSAYRPQQEQKTFSFQPSTVFEPGDCEPINQEFTIYGNQLEFVEVCSLEGEGISRGGGGGGGDPNYTPQPAPQFGLELRLRAPTGVMSVSVGDNNCKQIPLNCLGGGGRGASTPEEMLASTILYAEEPIWPVEFVIFGIDFVLPGPWAIQFDLPGTQEN